MPSLPQRPVHGDRLRIPSHNRKTQILRTQRRQDAKCPLRTNAVDPQKLAEHLQIERLKKPYRLISSSRTCRCVYIFTSSPSGGKTSSTDTATKLPTPIMPDSTTIRYFAISVRMPFTYEIMVNSFFIFSLVQESGSNKKRTLQNASNLLFSIP